MPKRILTGKVVRISEKTLSVVVESKRKHPLYNKLIKVCKKYLVHNPENAAFETGVEVDIIECKPISARKHFCVMNTSEVSNGN